MKNITRFAFACAAVALAAVSPASGEALTQLAGRTHYHGIAFARSGSATLLLATHHGVFAIDLTGEATQVSPVHDYMGFAPDPANPLSYYASGHPPEGGNSGFLKSADGGATWTQLSPGAGGPVDFHQMDVSPVDPNIIYGVYRELQSSTDGGETWSVMGLPPRQLIAIVASGVMANKIYAATKDGLHVSVDAGASWRRLDFSGEVVSLVKTAPNGILLAFVLGRGLVKAGEGTPTDWSVVANGFGDAIPLHLAIDPADANHLALTTQSNDVLESRDGGSNWKEFGKSP